MCGSCKAFTKKTYFFRHKKECRKTSEEPVVGLPLYLINEEIDKEVSSDYRKHVLESLRADELGNLCRTDKFLIVFGTRMYYNKFHQKEGREQDSLKSIRAELRRLGRLYEFFAQYDAVKKFGNVMDMFQRNNFEALRDAVSEYTKNENKKPKPGLKHLLQYTIKNAATIFKGKFLENNQDEEAQNIDKFLAVFDINQAEMFADAQHLLSKRRKVHLRKPVNLPLQEDLTRLKNYVMETVKKLTGGFQVWDSRSFITLRDCCCARLTLFNGRRGGEPARLMIYELEEALKDSWIDHRRTSILDPLEVKLLDDLKIAYMSGNLVISPSSVYY